MLSEDEHDMLLNATFQIIDSSLEPHTILDEVYWKNILIFLLDPVGLYIHKHYFKLKHLHLTFKINYENHIDLINGSNFIN